MSGWLRWTAPRPFLAVLMLAFVLRVAAALVLGNQVSGYSGANDEITYSMLGQRLATGHGLTFPQPWYPWIEANAPQSYFSAAMSLYVGAVYLLVGYQPLVARLTMAVLATAIVGVLMQLSRRLFGERVALVTGVLAACYSYLVFYGVTLVTETPFILSITAAISLAYTVVQRPTLGRWVALGVALAASVLFRMAVAFYVVPLLLWVGLHVPHARRRVLIPLAIIVLALVPFIIRNYLLWGHFLLLESQFGHVFWNGNHPDQHGNFHPFVVFPIPSEVLASHNDVLITNALLQMGLANVWHDPMNFVWLTVTRLREFFKIWPSPDSDLLSNALRVTSAGIIVPLGLVGVLLSRQRWRDLLPVLLFFLIHTGVYAISWTMIRYRIPLDALLLPFAAVALLQLAPHRLRAALATSWGAQRSAVNPTPPSPQLKPTSQARRSVS